MKRTVKNILFIAVIISSLLLSSCGGLKKHSSAGLVFYLPDDMKEMNVPYADKCYGNGEAEFYLYYYSRDELLTINLIDKDSTSAEYLQDLHDFNQYEIYGEYIAEIEFDEEINVATSKYIYTPENDFYFDFVIRNYDILVHVTMICDADLRDRYEPEFDKWVKKITLEELDK